MSKSEQTAIAILRAGCSYEEASQITGVSLERLYQLWKESQGAK
jgi:hypothetical protein